MEFEYRQELDRSVSQRVFAEEKVTLTVKVVNAELLAQITEGHVYVYRDSRGSPSIEGNSDIRDLVNAKAEEVAKEQVTKTPVVDIGEIAEQVKAIYEKVKAKDVAERAERQAREARERAADQHAKEIAIEGVSFSRYWNDVRIKWQGQEIKVVPLDVFPAVTAKEVYGMVLAYLQTELEKAEKAKADAEAKLSQSRAEILAELYESGEEVKISQPQTVKLRVVSDEDC
jgi:hypothetical protein